MPTTASLLLLQALDLLSTAIESTYNAGRRAGIYGWPLLRRAWAAIDWNEVTRTVCLGLLVTALLGYQLLRWCHRTLLRQSERLGAWSSRSLLTPPPPPATAIVTDEPPTPPTPAPVPPRPRQRQSTRTNAAATAQRTSTSPTKARRRKGAVAQA